MTTVGRTRGLTLLLSVLLCTGGCADRMRQRSLERVAKDWCQTIRASQVIPVYPLTEDLRPGDVFLVQTSIADEASRYKARGFLPLDDYRGRLPLALDTAYKGQYPDAYWQDVFGRGVPNARPVRTAGDFPVATPPAGTPPATPADPAKVSVLLSEANAPRAAFPSYKFDVSTSKGLRLAVPIQGVPVALGALRAESATGSVTIADARTYAADPQNVYEELEKWVNRPEIRQQLRSASRGSTNPVFLRVVTRVYLTGAVNVSLTRTSAAAGELAGGNAPNIDLIDEKGGVNQNNIEVLKALNGDSQPAPAPTATHGFDWANAGARFKFQSLSSSSATLAEMFDTLLVIGYLGFDAPVYLDGSIGSPLPTFLRLERLIASPNEMRRAEGRYLQQTAFLQKSYSAAPKDKTERIRIAKIIAGVSDSLDAKSFKKASDAAKSALEKLESPSTAPSEADPDLRKAIDSFVDSADVWVASDGDAAAPIRTQRFAEAFDVQFDASRVPAPKGK